MTELSLFSGVGGGLLGTKLLGWRTVGYVEWDEYCQRVLRARIRDGCLDDAPIFADVRAFDGLPYRGRVDIVTAGFPCPSFSVAGKQLAGLDPQNMWPDTIRVIREIEPPMVFLENVPGLLGRHGYFGTVLGDLAEAGFDAEWDCISAEEVGAPHIRERLWLAASNPNRMQLRKQPDRPGTPGGQGAVFLGVDGEARFASDPYSIRGLQQERGIGKLRQRSGDCSWWSCEPGVPGVAYGVAFGMERRRATGNGQVPRVVVEAWRRLAA